MRCIAVTPATRRLVRGPWGLRWFYGLQPTPADNSRGDNLGSMHSLAECKHRFYSALAYPYKRVAGTALPSCPPACDARLLSWVTSCMRRGKQGEEAVLGLAFSAGIGLERGERKAEGTAAVTCVQCVH